VEEKAPGKNVQGIKCKKRVAVNKMQSTYAGNKLQGTNIRGTNM
jgi:hypothetical protein